MGRFGTSTPARLAVSIGPANAFPRTAASTYTAPGITVPFGSLDRWYTARTTANAAAKLVEVVTFGDSTTYGSGGLYSWLQRIRDRSVSAGYADGGKGMFAGAEQSIIYDAPEVNGLNTHTGFFDVADGYDNLIGSYFYDSAGSGSITFNCLATGFRLWYTVRNLNGSFTYAVDGGSPVTVNAYGTGNPTCKYVRVTGLTAGVVHTVVITNGAGTCHVGFAPMNSVGICYTKQARSGATFAEFYQFFGLGAAPPNNNFSPWYQSPLGLQPVPVIAANGYSGNAVDTSYADADRIKPTLAMTDLGFNDLTASDGTPVATWVDHIHRFAAACRAANCDGLVLSGQLPYNANWPTYGPDRFAALRDTAAAENIGFVDMFYPIAGASLSYAGGTGNPHLSKAGYQAQADFLWDNLLGL